MDIKTAKYIIRYYNHLLSGEEKSMIEHATSSLALSPETIGGLLKEINWIEKNADTSTYFNMNTAPFRITTDSFDILIATKIMEKHSNNVFLNYCSTCGLLARTPFAKQCRCGNDWHHLPTTPPERI